MQYDATTTDRLEPDQL